MCFVTGLTLRNARCRVIIHCFCFDHLTNLFMFVSSWIYDLTLQQPEFSQSSLVPVGIHVAV